MEIDSIFQYIGKVDELERMLLKCIDDGVTSVHFRDVDYTVNLTYSSYANPLLTGWSVMLTMLDKYGDAYIKYREEHD